MKRAFVFPGQGSQKVGMGKEIASAFPIARQTFDEVDEALDEHLSSLIFEGSPEELTLTQNAQPAIMVTSIALLRVMQQELGITLQNDARYAAGHSLGEYTALVATGALSLADTACLLRLRGQAMQKAVPVGVGAMAALIGIDHAAIYGVTCDAAGKGPTAGKGSCVIANDNTEDQVVISGDRRCVMRAIELAKAKGAKRAILLDVSAPFHCPLMKPAAAIMERALADVEIVAPCVDIVTNVTAQAEHRPEHLRELLVKQVTDKVRWRESIRYLESQGVTEIVEVGSGQVLTSLNKRIAPALNAYTIGSLQDFILFAKAA